jgi:hypothetical protein
LEIARVPEDVAMELSRVAEALALELELAYARPESDNPARRGKKCILYVARSNWWKYE